MKMNMDALKSLELKLDEFGKVNGTIAEHESLNANSCKSGCSGDCVGNCYHTCAGSCKHSGAK